MGRMLIFAPTAYLFTVVCDILTQEGFGVLAAANNYEGLSAASAARLRGGLPGIWYLVIT